ncbi:hypothetical protein [Streptomyces sp. NPDC057694]|uniref:hypothetical protein n=1 Tax=Streptomyces sp. NPDC057694 TaxID=3346216 RepID=UPI00368E73B8
MTAEAQSAPAPSEPPPLTAAEADALIQLLRTGRVLADAVDDLGLPLAAVWPAARGNVRLTIALAGRDPDARDEAGRVARADYLRLLSLGVSAAHAELIVGMGQIHRWKAREPVFASAATAAVANAASYRVPRRSRVTVEAVRRFLDLLGTGASVRAASRAAGITVQTVYQRRQRDPAFAAAMDDARAAGERS